ncbi:MAG: right-handed parallel beta-helix repeat-containing protein [Saprospiraceae bacterium]
MKVTSILFLILSPLLTDAKTWLVGPGKQYAKPSEVASLVKDGDSVLIDAAEYKMDVSKWTAHNLKLLGVGGKAHLNAEGTSFGGKAIWVIAGNFNTIENIEFSNCTVVDRNGAGIRLEGTSLIVRHCYFHNNQNGILAGDNSMSDVLVEYSEFSRNGAGDGFSHNIYINHLRSFTFQFNYVHHAYYGHEVKSRAYKNSILFNRITNEDGDASYEIDLPNGGECVVMGNSIQQGKYSDNNTFISYGREGLTNPGPHNFIFVYNTIVNNEDKGIVLNVQSNMDTLFCANNLIAGNITLLSGIPKFYFNSHNILNTDISKFNFRLSDPYDYHLTQDSPGKDSALILKQSFLNIALNPDFEYVHPLANKIRIADAKPDIGCYEFQKTLDAEQVFQNTARLYFLPKVNQLRFAESEAFQFPLELTLELFNMNGVKCIKSQMRIHQATIELPALNPNLYIYKIQIGNQLISGLFVVTD